jgi:hypothetical protein
MASPSIDGLIVGVIKRHPFATAGILILSVFWLAIGIHSKPQQAASEPPVSSKGMKLKNFWSYELSAWDRCSEKGFVCQTYFSCDYSSQTCQQGHRARGSENTLFLFVLLDGNDRKTEIGHVFCGYSRCFSFDTGKAWGRVPVEPFEVREDMPKGCLPPSCDNWIDKNIKDNLLANGMTYPIRVLGLR